MDLGLTFSVDTDNFGAYEEIEVCQNVAPGPGCYVVKHYVIFGWFDRISIRLEQRVLLVFLF